MTLLLILKHNPVERGVNKLTLRRLVLALLLDYGLCRRARSNQRDRYRWSKELFDAGKERFAGEASREAISGEIKDIAFAAATASAIARAVCDIRS